MSAARASQRRAALLRWGAAVALGWALLAGLAMLAAEGAPRWPLATVAPPWWSGAPGWERLHAYAGVGLAGAGVLALLVWALRAQGLVRACALAGAAALVLAAASGVPLGWDGARGVPLGPLHPAYGAAALEGIEALHAGAALATPLLILAGLAASALPGAWPALRRAGPALREARRSLRDGVRPAVGRWAARLGAWAERR